MRPATPEEARAIAALEQVARTWLKSLWLFSASGRLHVMRAGRNGEQVHVGRVGGVDPAYALTTIDIPNGGGDW